MGFAAALGLLLLPAVFVINARAAESLDERYLAGLRDLGMYELAEGYCRTQLERSDLAPAQQATMAIELSRTLAEHAVNLPPAQRDSVFEQARQAAADFVRDQSDNPRRLLVETQGELAALARGEILREEAAILGDQQRNEQAQKWLREAIGDARSGLTRLEGDVQLELRRRSPRTPLADGALSLDELTALQNNLHYQLARAYRNQGLTYPADSADRSNSLLGALQHLAPVAQTTTDDRLIWQARLDEVACARLLRRFQDAGRAITRIEQAKPPAWVRLRLQAERIRGLLGQQRVDDALRLVNGTGHWLEGQQSAELELACLEAYLAAKQPDAAQQQAQRIAAGFGAYWKHRANTLLASSVTVANSGTAGRSALIAAAERYYHSGQLDAAIKTYDQAAGQARGAGDRNQAFVLSRSAAAVESSRGEFASARDRFRRLAVDNPRHQEAAAAHHLAILNAVEALRDKQQPDLSAYRELLGEHLSLWPQSATAGDVHWRRGLLHAAAGQWPQAVDEYRRVPAEDAVFAKALGESARAYRRWIDQLKSDGQPTTNSVELARQAADYFISVVTGPDGKAPEKWSPVHRQAVLHAATLWLYELPGAQRTAEEVLRRAIDESPDAADQWRANAQVLLVYALAAQGKQRDAGGVLGKIAQGSPRQLLELIDRLAAITDEAPAHVKVQLAGLQLEAIKLLASHRDTLPPAAAQTLDFRHADALATAGETDQARELLESLAKARPNDGAVQERLARLLIDSGDRPSLQAGLQRWRTIERRTEKASDRWFRAKYYQALTHQRLGQSQQAARIIQLLQVLHPELGGEPLKTQFLELLAATGKKPAK